MRSFLLLAALLLAVVPTTRAQATKKPTPAPTVKPTAVPAAKPTAKPTAAPQPTPRPTAPQFMEAKNLYEMARDNIPFPFCGDIGQNEAFQGTDLIDRNGVCQRVNICHGNAGFGWNQITVDRNAIGIDNNGQGGHAKFEHNDPSNPKREDYFPNTYSVPNPNGAGKNGYLDGNCGFVCQADDMTCPENQTPSPTAKPTAAPTPMPTVKPTASPTAKPTPSPTPSPTVKPTPAPTPLPTSPPTPLPTSPPTPLPTSPPTPLPTAKPTASPTNPPTPLPTVKPTASPTPEPTAKPTASPTAKPTASPTPEPTAKPTASPTAKPTASPTPLPTAKPTAAPTPGPTVKPTAQPTAKPTRPPTDRPTDSPTMEPTVASGHPSAMPTTAPPTYAPSAKPTAKPTPGPTAKPTAAPTPGPTAKPTPGPTAMPTPGPTAMLTAKPTPGPTAMPTVKPTASPTAKPTAAPTSPPTVKPTASPTLPPVKTKTGKMVKVCRFDSNMPYPYVLDTVDEGDVKDEPSTYFKPGSEVVGMILNDLCELVPKTSEALVQGDPHFETWGAGWFEYKGQCDMVLLDAPAFSGGKGLTVHIRTKVHEDYSNVNSVAIKIGEDVLEVNALGDYYLNGVQEDKAIKVGGYSFSMTSGGGTAWNKNFHLQIGKDEFILIQSFVQLLGIKFVKASYANYHDATGMLGSYGSGHMFARDGKTVVEDPLKFAQEWQVTGTDDKLFRVMDAYPQAPQQCILPVEKPAGRRRVGESIALDTAQKACASKSSEFTAKKCVDLVIATRDVRMAGAGFE